MGSSLYTTNTQRRRQELYKAKVSIKIKKTYSKIQTINTKHKTYFHFQTKILRSVQEANKVQWQIHTYNNEFREIEYFKCLKGFQT